MSARPALRVVESVEAELARLFVEEDAAVRHLAAIRQAQGSARKRYAEKHGLLCLPHLATIRQAIEQ